MKNNTYKLTMGACANINNWCQISAEVPTEDISLKTKSKVGISRDQSKNDIRSEIFFDQNVKAIFKYMIS